MALIIFQLSLPVVASLGFHAPSGTDPSGVFNVSWDWGSFLVAGLPILGVGALANFIGFRLNIGAVVFAAVFMVSQGFFSGTMRWLQTSYGVDATVSTLINVAIWAVFVYAFVQLSSAPTEQD